MFRFATMLLLSLVLAAPVAAQDIFIPSQIFAGDDILIILSGGTPNASVNLRIIYLIETADGYEPYVTDVPVTLNAQGRAELRHTILPGLTVTLSVDETTWLDDRVRFIY